MNTLLFFLNICYEIECSSGKQFEALCKPHLSPKKTMSLKVKGLERMLSQTFYLVLIAIASSWLYPSRFEKTLQSSHRTSIRSCMSLKPKDVLLFLYLMTLFYIPKCTLCLVRKEVTHYVRIFLLLHLNSRRGRCS